jgi:hypothetical protein
MSQVLVWKCDADGKLFEDKSKYQKHLRKLAAKRAAERKIAAYETDLELFFDTMGQVGSFSELEQFIKDNWARFRTNCHKNGSWRKRSFAKNDDQLISLSLSGFYFKQDLRNSHDAPRKGVENFDSRSEHNKGKPIGYPGWSGRISYNVTNSTGFGSDYFERTPICTGSGGGGDRGLSYELRLWAADFPVMWKKHCRDTWVMLENQERQHVWRAIGGQGLCIPATEADIPADWVCPDPMEATYRA